MPARQFDFLAVLLLLLICTVTVSAEETATSGSGVAVATDTPVTPTPDAKVVAREILKLQQEMGGSIVDQLSEPQPSPLPDPRPAWAMPYVQQSSESPVVALRETAWQLDQAAHRLEMLDLYDEADAVRETANVLRNEARVRRRSPQKSQGAAGPDRTGTSAAPSS